MTSLGSGHARNTTINKAGGVPILCMLKYIDVVHFTKIPRKTSCQGSTVLTYFHRNGLGVSLFDTMVTWLGVDVY